MAQTEITEEEATARGLLDFINASPSPFHAVEQCIQRLKAQGFEQLSERDRTDWSQLKRPGKYYITRNQSSIIAFAIPSKWTPGDGFSMIGAHTDSPVFKLKPRSKLTKSKHLQLGVSPYGGGLWRTWFDRDLSVAGRVITTNDDRSAFSAQLVRIDDPICRIPNLAIHLESAEERKAFAPNKENHCCPMLATCIKEQLLGPAKEEKSEDKADGSEDVVVVEAPAKKCKVAGASKPQDNHHALMLDIVAKKLGVNVANMVDFELVLYDTQAGTLGGIFKEFVFSPRLDNLCMCFTALQSLFAASGEDDQNMIQLCCFFDHEEVGSVSRAGANSSYLRQVLRRVNGAEAFEAALANSVLISADMAHALHPNYAGKHEKEHGPLMQNGLVLKTNENQRYATTTATTFHIEEIARRHNIPLQKFCVRSDMRCGSTIGPALSAQTGVRTFDVGIPQLSMHSIREQCGTADVQSTIKLFTAFYREFAALDKQLTVD